MIHIYLYNEKAKIRVNISFIKIDRPKAMDVFAQELFKNFQRVRI